MEDDARRFLKLAGDRETSLDLEQATVSYRRALEPAPPPIEASVPSGRITTLPLERPTFSGGTSGEGAQRFQQRLVILLALDALRDVTGNDHGLHLSGRR